jgi:GTP cyclohydrolase I
MPSRRSKKASPYEKNPNEKAVDLLTKEAEALAAVRTLLEYIGEDPARAGLAGTPSRVLKAWREDWGAGYRAAMPRLSLFREPGIDYNQMIVVQGMEFHSMCEHHLAPFFGTVDVGYIPSRDNGILGLSKFSRLANFFAQRLQVQERLTAQIADALSEHVSPHVAVRIRAKHMCMCSRGVRQRASVTTTAAIRGLFYDSAPRNEFYCTLQAGAAD